MLNILSIFLDIFIVCALVIIFVLIFKTNEKKQQKFEEKLNDLLNATGNSEKDNAVALSKVDNVNNTVNSIKDLTVSTSKDNENIIKNVDLLIRLLNESKENQASDSKGLEEIKNQVQGITDIMLNAKHRGTFGEYQLNNLMSVYCGDNTTMWEAQYHLKNGTIGDVALHLPQENNRVLIIDSKFPMENYVKLSNYEGNENMNPYVSSFKGDIKKHINDISKKYINSETVEQAIMFIPSEAVYYYICSKCPDLLEESYKKKVLITSPTTLIGVTFTLVNINKEFQRAQNLKKIEKAIVSLKTESTRLIVRGEKTEKALNTAMNAMKELNITCGKIDGKINKIYDGYTDEDDETE